MSAPRVSVAVLHHRGPELLDIVLGSLARQTYAEPFETIVVDDASSDGSAEHLQAAWPQVRAVRTGESSIGVTRAMNLAVASARGELIAILNNDIELEPGWLEAMVAALDGDPGAGSAACKLRNYYDRGMLDGAGDVLLRSGAGGKRGNGERDVGQYDEEAFVLGPTGGAALYRRSAMDAVGPFDESFGAYFEDVDWALRAQRLGLRCRYTPAAVGYHMEGRTTGGVANPVYYTLQWRNSLALIVKNLPAGWIVRHMPFICAHQLAGLVRGARRGMLGAHLRAYRGALRELPRWLRARQGWAPPAS